GPAPLRGHELLQLGPVRLGELAPQHRVPVGRHRRPSCQARQTRGGSQQGGTLIARIPKGAPMSGERPELVRLREVCLALPEVTERLSHGSPAWFIRGKKTLAMSLDDHHGDGRLALWCPAPPGVQDAMVTEEPERFFRPPYVGPSGGLGVRLDREPERG